MLFLPFSKGGRGEKGERGEKEEKLKKTEEANGEKEEKEEEPQQEQLSFYTSKASDEKKKEEAERQEALKEESSNRKKVLKDLSFKWGTSKSIHEMENEPAYKRRGVDLENEPHSSENNNSRYSLGEEGRLGDVRPEIRKNNSFLHDNVD